jgi:hypothetical protein
LPALRAATAAVAVLLLIVIGADRLTRPNNPPSNQARFSAMVAPTPTAPAETSGIVNSGGANAAPTQETLGEASGSGSSESSGGAESSSSQPAPAAANVQASEGEASDSAAGVGAAAPNVAAAKVAIAPEASPAAELSPTPTSSPTAVVTPSPEPVATPAPVAATSPASDSRRGWRLAELGLGLLLLWLIVTYIGAWQSSRRRA